MENAVIDYSKMKANGGSRDFQSGFINLFGKPTEHIGHLPAYPGIKHISSDEVPTVPAQCDVVEHRPTYILSNDDIFNLGHYMNDVMGIWNMLTLSSRSSQDALLVNIDGVRAGGPAGGQAHRLMIISAPDQHGPYSEFYYHKWFYEVKRGMDLGSARICYKELYFFPLPGVPWFWNNWGRPDECSLQSSSPLYQSFNMFLRQKLLDSLGNAILPNPPLDHVHVVIEVRKINPSKRNSHSSSRFIANLDQLIARLQTIPNVKVTAQDFAELSFVEQIKLAHSASILMSMHGAGTTHIFHMALGQKNCCGLVELFPDPSIDLHLAHGYSNLARMLGLHHARYVADAGRTRSAGTEVDVEKLHGIVSQMAVAVQQQPTCLFDVKDTRYPLYE